MPAAPKSPYHFTQYLLGPRHNRTYLADGGPGALDELMLDLPAGDPIPVEEYRGLPDYVRDQGLSAPPARSFAGPGAHLALSGETVPSIPPDLFSQDWRNAAPTATPKPAGVSRGGASAPVSAEDLPEGLTGAYGDVLEQYKNYPTMQQPKWWQRGLGAAAGFGAGWSNAAGRTRHPIDIGAMQQNVLHPGYNEQVAEWRAQMVPLQAKADIEAQKQNAALKMEQIAGQRAQREATADWRKHLADPHYGKTQISPKLAQEYDLMPEKDGTYWVDKVDYSRMVTNAKQQANPRPVNVAPGGTLVDATSGKVIYQAAPKQPNAPGGIIGLYLQKHNGDYAAALDNYNRDRIQDHIAMRAPSDPNTVLMREQLMEDRRNKDVEGVGQWKDVEERKLMQDRQRAIAQALGTSPGVPLPTEEEIWKQGAANPQALEKLKAINRQFAPRMQAIQNEFVNRARNRGIQADRYQINPDTFEAVRQGAPAPASIGTPHPLGGPPAIPSVQGGTNRPIKNSPTSVVLPDGRTKHFPNEAATNAFLAATAR